MKRKVIYIHGQGGNPGEAEHYRALFPDADVVGLRYSAETPWDAREEFPRLVKGICGEQPFTLIANSIGAYFAMCALNDRSVERAYFISPVVDMEKLIMDMMRWANVSEDQLREQGRVETDFGQTLSWEYLCYAREHTVTWHHPTSILYGSKDHLTTHETMADFAERIGASLTVMEGGEHWFHTEEQVQFLDQWITE